MTMVRLSTVMAVIALIACGVAYASSGASFSGDRALIMKFRLDDGMTGGPGYRRAIWTSPSGLSALLVVRNSKGKIVESLAGGNPTSPSGGLTWILSSGEMINHAYPPAGLYFVTLTLTAYKHGSVSLLTTDTVVAKWSAKIPDHTKLCVPHVSGSSYIGCG